MRLEAFDPKSFAKRPPPKINDQLVDRPEERFSLSLGEVLEVRRNNSSASYVGMI
jgi:hypothetical protein